MTVNSIDSAHAVSSECEFGIYDRSDWNNSNITSQGWELVSWDLLNYYKESFVNQYNKNEGIKAIDNFESINCCFAGSVSDNSISLSVIIGNYSTDKQLYGWVTPAEPPDGEVCTIYNAPKFEKGSNYIFFQAGISNYLNNLTSSQLMFSISDYCTFNENDHNPAIYGRNLLNCPH